MLPVVSMTSDTSSVCLGPGSARTAVLLLRPLRARTAARAEIGSIHPLSVRGEEVVVPVVVPDARGQSSWFDRAVPSRDAGARHRARVARARGSARCLRGSGSGCPPPWPPRLPPVPVPVPPELVVQPTVSFSNLAALPPLPSSVRGRRAASRARRCPRCHPTTPPSPGLKSPTSAWKQSVILSPPRVPPSTRCTSANGVWDSGRSRTVRTSFPLTGWSSTLCLAVPERRRSHLTATRGPLALGKLSPLPRAPAGE